MDLSYGNVCSIENLFLAWERFRRGKGSRLDVMEYGRYLEDNLFELQRELANGMYRHAPYEPFTIFDPKQRQIHKAVVRDRIVHQAAVQIIEPLFEKRFIFDSYSCRIDKGTHEAVKRLRSFLNKTSGNNTETVHALKCDIRKFFASVSHRRLLQLLAQRISDERIMQLLSDIVSSFYTAPGFGIPLGNLTSQLFANVYLHELDYFVKFTLREKYYVRYCDDFILLSESRGHVQELVTKIEHFLTHSLGLGLHPDKVQVRTWEQGIDFLGYVLLPHATVLRTKTKKRMIKRLSEQNVSSYLGLCSHANAFELERLIRTIIA